MSCDQYRLPNGLIVNCTSEAIEEQIKQEWVYHGKKDTRTLEDLQKA